MNTKRQLRAKRHRRIRATITGTASRPRLAVYRSNMRLYAQLIDDTAGQTIASLVGDGKNIKAATTLGEALTKQAIAKKITHVVFDRGGYRYHGRIKAFAEALRAGGIQF